MKDSRLLIIGPSFRRDTIPKPIPAIMRYDGIFYRVTRKHHSGNNPEIMILTEELNLINENKKIPYNPPKGNEWTKSKSLNYSEKFIEKKYKENKDILKKAFKNKKFKEVFIAAGKLFRTALPDFTEYDCKVILPHGGPGPTAKSLKEWLRGKSD